MDNKHSIAWERMNDDFFPELVVRSNMVCKDCKFRKRDLVENGEVIVTGYDNVFCDNYKQEDGAIKPQSVLDGGKCKFYEKEQE